ncbi:glycosyl transferase [Tomitella biformata]|uniref:glycosyl transferase n=1 Tax=Tomitella biformata TaxID=630403 RepID=UPI000465C1E3|nr:glycosyl transferase [Tomitella biformata]
MTTAQRTTELELLKEGLPTRRRRFGWSPRRSDLLAAVGFTGLSVFVLGGQWRAPTTGYLVGSDQDQRMWEWFFAVGARAVFHLENPLGSVLQNYPQGVNLMGNTAMLGLSIPLAPVTAIFGPTMTWTLAMTIGLAGTAYAWYWLFSRYAVESRAAAAVGGLLCGFAPAMISHANGHPNFVVLGVLPLILACAISLGRGARRRVSVVLGLLIAWQIMLGEEPLLILAIGSVIFGVCYLACAPRLAIAMARTLARPLLLAAAVAAVLVAVPLWWQFFGPQSYSNLTHGSWSNDLQSLWKFSPQTLGGLVDGSKVLGRSGTEFNSYFGWPLLAMTAGIALWLRRSPLARAASITALVMIVLSLGPTLKVGGADTGIPMPWRVLDSLPLFESVLETRLTMAAVPLIGLLLALATDRVLRRGSMTATGAWVVLLALTLAPLAPLPISAVVREPTPVFFEKGVWQDYVDHGSVVVVPLPQLADATALTWQIDAKMGFPLAGGYFVGPAGPDDKGGYGAPTRPTAKLLGEVLSSGVVPQITAEERAQAVVDLRFWQADVVVLPTGKNSDALRTTVQDLLGDAGHRAADVWVWDVQSLVGATR